MTSPGQNNGGGGGGGGGGCGGGVRLLIKYLYNIGCNTNPVRVTMMISFT